MRKPENHLIVIFGASGDLTSRKLIPALARLFTQKLLPGKFAILGLGRTEMDDASFRKSMTEALQKYSHEDGKFDDFISQLYYLSIDYTSVPAYSEIKSRIDELAAEFECRENVLFYLATPPKLYELIPSMLAEAGLNKKNYKLIIEKPFGNDLESARKLNANLLNYFNEDQIYRIDHYLGKETVQNIMVTRFSNTIFEPLWNRNYIHHVEITSAESIGVEKRGGYYDSSGALRDMIQNHLMQLVALVAMEPPVMSDSNSIRNETLKVFQSLRYLSEEDVLNNVIRGQYLASTVGTEKYSGYREEEGVAENSKTETYLGMKFFIDNWRWSGVPFYIRTGKRLPTRVTELVIHFRNTPHHIFCNAIGQGADSNQLIMRIQPDEGVLMKFGMKVPGAGFTVQNVNMDFHYSDISSERLPEAYERLLLDSMQNDSTLYSRGDAVEASWKFVDPILKVWEKDHNIPLYGYPSGTWGPEVADKLIEETELSWRYPCKNLANDGIYCEL